MGKCSFYPLYGLQEFTVCSRYLKCIDRFYNNYISCFMTGGSKYEISKESQN